MCSIANLFDINVRKFGAKKHIFFGPECLDWVNHQENLEYLRFKGCVCYNFANLFCMSKKEHLRNKEKCFLFHFKSSSRSWDNNTFNILDTQMSWCHQMPKHETWNTYWITWEVNTVWQWNLASLCSLTVCSCHLTYAFQSESTL